MEEPDMYGDPIHMMLRWFHFLAGITWIGFLYYLNLVNVRMMPSLDASVRPAVIGANLARVMAWFRHSAWVTVLVGILLYYWIYLRANVGMRDPKFITISLGGLLGIIMVFNVWVLIWPNQKKIIAAANAGQPPDPAWGRVALYTSRTNFTLSFPMLLYMGAASHFPMDFTPALLTGIIAGVIGAMVVFTVQKWAPAKF
jgi:uncharacterized membrane protein